MRVLQIEDDAGTAQSIELMLRSEGFKVETTDLGEEGADLAKLYEYDVITLDLNLPDIPGVEALRQIRAAGVRTPVLILTGDARIETKVKCFGLGADDYMTKPFHKAEMVCRLLALIRRAAHIAEPVVALGNIEVDLNAKRVRVEGLYAHLTGHEWAVLELLTLRKGQAVTKDAFMNHLYGGRDEPELKIIDVFVCKLRRKLGPAAWMVQTVWGRGYTLSDERAAALPRQPTKTFRPVGADCMKAKVLRVLLEQSTTLQGIKRALSDANLATVTSVVAATRRDGLIAVSGRRGGYDYRITPEGRTYLRRADGQLEAA